MSTDKTIQNAVNGIVAFTLNCPEADVSPDKHLCYDLLADSLALLDIIIAIEGRFRFDFKSSYLNNISYVKDLYQVVDEHLASQLNKEW